MAAEGEPDLAGLFAPINVERAVLGVLAEAQDALRNLDDPVDAELWGSDVIGALTAAASDEDQAMAALAGTLVPAAEQASTPEALAMLRVFAAMGSPRLRTAASQAAVRVAAGRVASGAVAEAEWASVVGMPEVGHCWHYADVGGRQESLTLAFAYGDKHHAVSVLIDHYRGGKIKDVWVSKGSGLLLETELSAGTDPLVVFEMLAAADARKRLEQALAAGECPEQADQADDITAHRALLRSRLELLSTA
jgi:hypothetical protein